MATIFALLLSASYRSVVGITGGVNGALPPILRARNALRVSANPSVWFGEGCFWERQYAYVQVELAPTGPFKRSNRTVTSVVGYAGSKKSGPDGHVCYDNGGPTDYGDLGHCETVRVNLDPGKEKQQFAALVKEFFDSFTPTKHGFARPDTPPNLPFGDQGASYRSVVGIPGGVNGALYPILRAGNAPRGPHNLTMVLKADHQGNGTQDEFNTVCGCVSA